MNTFLKKSVVLALAAIMSFSCTACGSGAETPIDDPIETDAGPHLNIRITEEILSLDPHKWTSDSEHTIISQIYEPLYRLADDTSEIPVLATGYTIAEDDLSYTFTLREDAVFSNGDALTVDDVVYSFERCIANASPFSGIASIDSVESDEEAHTVTLHLKTPVPGLLADISDVPIICRAFAEENADDKGNLGYDTCGTGPYIYHKQTKGSSVTLTVNPNYSGEAPAIRTLRFRVVPDEEEAARLLQNGELDIAGFSSGSKEMLISDEAINTAELPENHVTFLVINTRQPLFENKYIRRAISCAINKEALNLETQNGSAMIADSMATPYMVGYSEITPKYGYDLEHTRQLLNGCGYLETLDIGEIQVLTDSYLADMGAVLQQQLEEADILCTITELDARELFDNCMNGNFNVALMVQYNNFDMSWMSTYYGTEYIDILNMAGYSDLELDELLVKANRCTDPERRRELYNEVLIEAEKTCAYIPIYNRSICHAWARDLNYTPTIHTPIYADCSWN